MHIRAASSQPTLANKVIAKIKKKKYSKKILLLPRGAKETQRVPTRCCSAEGQRRGDRGGHGDISKLLCHPGAS